MPVSKSLSTMLAGFMFSSICVASDSQTLAENASFTLMEVDSALNKINYALAPPTSCAALSEKFSGDEITSIQKKREWRDYENKLIKLKANLVDVREIPLSDNYAAVFQCEDSPSLVSDFVLEIPASLEDYAFSLQTNTLYEVTGRLTDYSEMLGITLIRDDLGTVETSDGECQLTYDDIDVVPDGNSTLFLACGDTIRGEKYYALGDRFANSVVIERDDLYVSSMRASSRWPYYWISTEKDDDLRQSFIFDHKFKLCSAGENEAEGAKVKAEITGMLSNIITKKATIEETIRELEDTHAFHAESCEQKLGYSAFLMMLIMEPQALAKGQG